MAKTPEKADGAFRTIREVADWLVVPTHVLRFWESKFDQVQPVKGAGGRRYYRPEDMRLLGGIKVLLHDQGLTIRGVAQKIVDEGAEPVMALAPELDTPAGPPQRTRKVIRPGDEVERGRVLPFDRNPEAAPEEPKPKEPAGDEAVAPEPAVAEPAEAPSGPVVEDPADPVEATAPTDDVIADPHRPTEDAAPSVPEITPAEPDGMPPPSTELPPEAAIADHPPSRALRKARSAREGGARVDQRKLKRLVRRLNGLIEEIEDDLAG
ncbi:MerR family transcriptional regulator [Jannaschia aquimarina]|uniref:MerR family regulatory protein n=1 Tax=Jannaschia aquimarina TaxID=935700 RepID=A0A0D1EJK5_9RHOB|nr:MerR family transcriptional regulator [Jannaschia aquimarina]KIT17764.1 MerR family regulatory protein [Jannaschia aquimarina]SNS95966.1 MerR HTH family regulatory protein [Jannaschia aquimarina]